MNALPRRLHTGSSRVFRAALTAVILCSTSPADSLASQGWRGDGTGVFEQPDSPLNWSPREGVLWVRPTDQWSNASPVVAGGQVYLTEEPTRLLALSAETGELLWSRDTTYMDTLTAEQQVRARQELLLAGEVKTRIDNLKEEYLLLKKQAREGRDTPQTYGRLEALSSELEVLSDRYAETRRHRTPQDYPFIGHASSTPVVEGDSVYVVFANGVAARYGSDGALKWATWVGLPHPRPLGLSPGGHAASPIYAEGRLVVGLGRLTALDGQTGRILWRGPEYPHFGTPRFLRSAGRLTIVTPSGEAVDFHSGEVLAKITDVPLWYQGTVVSGTRAFLVGCIEANVSSARAYDLVVEAGQWRWKPVWSAEIPPVQLAEALVYDGLVYSVNEDATLHVRSAEDGSFVYEKSLALGVVYSSPAVANGKLYVFDDSGGAVVLLPGRTYQRVGTGRLPDKIRASPTFSGGRLYLRYLKGIYAIGAPSGTPPPVEGVSPVAGPPLPPSASPTTQRQPSKPRRKPAGTGNPATRPRLLRGPNARRGPGSTRPRQPLSPGPGRP
jgi:outer membrane protein assembly factor BamB